MRQILIGDLLAAANVLKARSLTDGNKALDHALYCAHCADKIRKKTGRATLGLGDGTLQAACSAGRDLQDQRFDSGLDVDCLERVCAAINRWRERSTN